MSKVFISPSEWTGGMEIRVIDTAEIVEISIANKNGALVLYKNGIRAFVPFDDVCRLVESWAPEHLDIWRKVEAFYKPVS